MGELQRFEDLIAWREARDLTREIYRTTRNGELAKDYGLSGQMRRAAVSIMANIAEGFERTGQGEFFQFLSIAKASCAEVRSHLYAALDAGYLSQDAFQTLLDMAEEVARIVGGLRVSVGRDRAPARQRH